ncbi:MAG: carboxypeptidase regulatory-like domain-containing protein [bacterium]|nr:carboxypeptidase regulatory-like domain-containing protein [bacterium]
MRAAYYLLFASLLAAQTQKPAPEVKPEEFGKIEGMVIDAVTEAPLGKAELTLRKIGGAGSTAVSTRSDSAGKFLFENVEPGRHRMTAWRNGYAPHNMMAASSQGSPGSLNLAAKQHLKGIVVAMQPGALVTGRVVDEDGDPVAYARVSLVKPVYIRGNKTLESVGSSDGTDDRGEYRLFGVPPGRYHVRASYRGMSFGAVPQRVPAGPRQGEMSYATVYYPGVVDPSQAAPVELRAGEERRGVDFRLVRVRTVRVSGRVIAGGTGQPTADARLMVSKAGSVGMEASSIKSAAVDPKTGRFEVAGLEPGSYSVSAFMLRGTRRWFGHAIVEAGDTSIENLELRMWPGVDLKGVIQIEGDPEGDPPTLQGSRVYLSQTEAGRGPFFAGGVATVSSDGSFEMASVAPMKFSVRMSRLPEGAYLKAAKFGTEEVLDEGMVVSRADSGRLLELVVSPHGGSVEGVVVDDDGKPVINASVALVPEKDKRAREELFQLVTTDQQGGYAIHGIPPGDYALFAWEKLEFGSHRDPVFLEAYEDDGVTLSVEEKSQQVIELELLLPKP